MTSRYHAHDEEKDIIHVSAFRAGQLLFYFGVFGLGFGGLLFGDNDNRLIGTFVMILSLGLFLYTLQKAAREESDIE